MNPEAYYSPKGKKITCLCQFADSITLDALRRPEFIPAIEDELQAVDRNSYRELKSLDFAFRICSAAQINGMNSVLALMNGMNSVLLKAFP